MKRLGRPPVDATHPPARINVTIDAAAYDRLHQLAHDYGISIPEVVRRTLTGRRDFLTQKLDDE